MMETGEPWLLFEKDGRHHQVYAPEGKRPHNPRGLEAIRVDRHTADPACEFYDRAKGEWVFDAAKRARLAEEARVATMTAADVYRDLMLRIAELEARLAKLEKR